MKPTKVLFFILPLAVFAIFLYPVKVDCGAPDKLCASGLSEDNQGKYYTTYYEIEPLGIRLIEGYFRIDLSFAYSSGIEKHYVD